MSRLLLTTERLVLFGTLLASFGELHPLCDPWVQGPKTASRKRLYGEDLVQADGSPATPDSTRPTMTTSTLGRRAVACHVASLGFVASARTCENEFPLVKAMKRPGNRPRHVLRTGLRPEGRGSVGSRGLSGGSCRTGPWPWGELSA
ncbi:hypothetical protein [Streptomyces sp. NPDC057545]|uniref:hypothetical protein n=1 Tax=Streptomyces sp. NPDC057545 TaxID=3346164 RepID=UPI0036A76573